jgi:hypothetical protein
MMKDSQEMELLQSQLWRPYLCVATNKQKKNKTMDKEDEWNGMFNELQQYYIKYGHTAVPPTYPDNPQLHYGHKNNDKHTIVKLQHFFVDQPHG